MNDKTYFKMVDRPMEKGAAAQSIYLSPNKENTQYFNEVNGFNSSKEMLYPGHLIIAPSLDSVASYSAASLKNVPLMVNYEARHSNTAADHKTFNEDFNLLQALVTSKEDQKTASKIFKGAEKFVGKNFELMSRDFKKLEDVYEQARKSKIPLHSQQFKAMRAPIEKSLKSHMPNFAKSAILKHAENPSMKDAIGISHRHLSRAFRTSGDPVEIKQISSAINKASKFSGAAKNLGMVGKVLSVGSSVNTVVEDYKTKGSDAGIRTAGRETAGYLGGAVVGGWGATGGAMATLAAVAFFGVSTGGVGFVLVGIGAVAGGLAGGYIGSEGSKMAYDGAATVVDAGSDKMIDWVLKNDSSP